MKLNFKKAILGAVLLWGMTAPIAFAQVITAGPDSTVVRTDADPLPPEQKGWTKPDKAALMSAVVPGLGQVYNGSYWKVPIVYLAGGACVYFLQSHHKRYLSFRSSLAVRNDGDPNTKDIYEGRYNDDQLRRGRDQYRRWRDQTIMYSIITYGLQVTEAYVHAHLKDFDISDDLVLNFRPDLIRTAANTYSPAFSLSINLKK